MCSLHASLYTDVMGSLSLGVEVLLFKPRMSVRDKEALMRRFESASRCIAFATDITPSGGVWRNVDVSLLVSVLPTTYQTRHAHVVNVTLGVSISGPAHKPASVHGTAFHSFCMRYDLTASRWSLLHSHLSTLFCRSPIVEVWRGHHASSTPSIANPLDELK